MILKTAWTGLQQNDPITVLNLLRNFIIGYDECPLPELYNQHHSTAQSEQGQPITLSATFSHQGRTFLYDVSFLPDTIIHEALYLLPQDDNTNNNQDQDQQKQPIYIANAIPGDPGPRHLRVFEDDGTENPAHVDDEAIATMTNEEYIHAPILGIGSDRILWCGTLADIAFDWFIFKLELFPDTTLEYGSILITMHQWPYFAKMANVIVPKLFPHIRSIEGHGQLPNYTLTFIHQSPDGTTHEVDAEDESEDLLFFLCKLRALAGVVFPDRTIVIDKLDDGLTPEQAQWLVDVFRPLVHQTSQLVYKSGDEVMWVEGD